MLPVSVLIPPNVVPFSPCFSKSVTLPVCFVFPPTVLNPLSSIESTYPHTSSNISLSTFSLNFLFLHFPLTRSSSSLLKFHNIFSFYTSMSSQSILPCFFPPFFATPKIKLKYSFLLISSLVPHNPL